MFLYLKNNLVLKTKVVFDVRLQSLETNVLNFPILLKTKGVGSLKLYRGC